MRRIASNIYQYLKGLLMIFRLPRIIRETSDTQTPVLFRHWFRQKFLSRNRQVYWPVDPSSIIRNQRNVHAGVETCPGYEKGCYIQAINPIYIGDYTQIANNVGIISANHDLYDLRHHIPGTPVKIGSYCWLGMGVIVLPGVELGDFTIVGAGSVVTKSFPEGHCVIAGNPARVIKTLEPEKCVRYKSKHEYHGFYRKGEEFETYRKKYLSV